jgi:hypothetical protein
MPTRHLVIISGVYLAFCAFYLWRMDAATYPGFPLDDSWIHQVFARNLATGHGFSFNPDVPIAGATAPLWTVLLVPTWLLLGPITGGIALGMLAQWLAILAVYKLTERLTDKRCLAFMTCILTILCWPVIWGALSGMEIGLYSALSLWGLFFYFKSNALDDRYNYLSYFLFTMAFLARPECGLFLAAAIFRDIYCWWKHEKKEYSAWAVKITIIALIFGPYLIFNYSTSGNFMPQTYTVKVQNKGLLTALYHGEIKRVIKAATVLPYMYFLEFYRSVINLNPLIVLAIIPGIIKLFNHDKIDKSKRLMLVLLMIFYVPVIGAISPLKGVVFQNYRFSTNLLPLVILIGCLGLYQSAEILGKRSKNRLLIIGAVLILVGWASGLLFSIVDEFLARSLLEDPSALDPELFAVLDRLVWYIGSGTMIMGGLFICGFIIISARFQSLVNTRQGRIITLIVISLSAGIITLRKADRYANNVKNINECDVAAGQYLAGLAVPGDVVAVNDIGAIGYFSKMEIFDLKGLASPEVTIPMINDDSLAFVYMFEHSRVDYLAINPGWFKHIPKRTDIFKPIRIFHTDYNTILYEDTLMIYKSEWPVIESNNSVK